jgi:hypothetical protein
MTSAIIDSRDFLDKRARENARVLLPEGTRIAFTGGPDCNDHSAIWDVLDRVHARHGDMVLLHGATPTGAERAAACWADTRRVPQVAFRPDWNRHKKAAPFKRNDRMLEALPVGLVVFPAPASRTIWLTRRARWAFRSGISGSVGQDKRRLDAGLNPFAVQHSRAWLERPEGLR